MPPKVTVTGKNANKGRDTTRPRAEKELNKGKKPTSQKSVMKQFCQNITADRAVPRDVLAALEFAQTRDIKYVQCQGTTTVFGDKDCYHRQCRCITRNEKKLYAPDPFIFTATEIETMGNNGLLQLEYQICHRHSPSLRIPFPYLENLELASHEMEEQIRGGIIDIGKITTKSGDDEFNTLLAQISTLVPYLTHINRQEAADARASLKRAIDMIVGANVDDMPSHKRKLQSIVDGIYTHIDGAIDTVADTTLDQV